jgi:hypothetical protein
MALPWAFNTVQKQNITSEGLLYLCSLFNDYCVKIKLY